MRDELEAKLENLPPAPGCYLFKDKKAEVLYVGKAKSLRAWVQQLLPERLERRARHAAVLEAQRRRSRERS